MPNKEIVTQNKNFKVMCCFIYTKRSLKSSGLIREYAKLIFKPYLNETNRLATRNFSGQGRFCGTGALG